MKKLLALSLLLGMGSAALAQTTITIATVNNPDMVTMQKLTPEFEKANPDIKVKWVVLPENELRQKITLDVASGAGTFDIATVGAYEVPIWAKNGWIEPLGALFNKNPNIRAAYDLDDLLAPVRKGLSYNNLIHALPFYAESSMTFYRKDLFQQAGLKMPVKPTWTQIERFAKALHKPDKGQYGICLRGLPGWGENMAVFGTVVNTFGGRWFDMNWNAQVNSAAWKRAMTFYTGLIKKYGPPGVTSNGFTENLTLFSQGKCGMWIDATVAAGFVTDPAQSKVVNSVGFANSPTGPGTPRGSNWLWIWSLAIPKSTTHEQEAFKFITWATSKEYIQLVAKEKGNWGAVPPGTRKSTYASAEYQKAAGAFANIVLDSINRADPTRPTKDPVPYTGVQFVAIPEFQALGTQVGQYLAGVLSGQMTVDQALSQGQAAASRVSTEGGYKK
ncbi:ABC transporter substrate-binding protein [Deinococcus cellulosilyticus]|uniref:ABC transporter substrate-binding protein n=2 Tax=Deinococcus cellulosilyticus TaxID=401558 RepID=UPI003605D64F